MRVAAGFVAALVCSNAFAALPALRTLSFEERVNAQAQIERVYYTHQIGATKPFEEAVPRSMLENKVRKYLEQTAALKRYWKTAVTDETLQRELERMAQGTRMPERLQELYTALGNDTFLIKECLARPALVDRLTHNFYAFDPTIHTAARAQADAIHQLLASGELSPKVDHPNRTVTELVVGGNEDDKATTRNPFKQRLTREEFQKQRAELPARVGELSDVTETPDEFAISVVLSEATSDLRVASYVMRKTTWDAWSETVHGSLGSASVAAVASNNSKLPPLHRSPSIGAPTACTDGWDNGILGAMYPRSFHSAVWTGSLMVVWGGYSGGYAVNTGGRYDPATDTWASTSTAGAPSPSDGPAAVWTGSLMIIWGGTYGPDNAAGTYDPLTDRWRSISTIGAPSARYAHSSVWTGSKMVVWGGYDLNSSIPLNTGGRYDPESDTWTPTATLGAPSARGGATAVWTGSAMVVWGGFDGSGYVDTGGRYNPVSDIWTPTSTAGAPSARLQHTAVWTGSVMVVWGGLDDSGEFNTGGLYDPVNDLWTPTSTAGAPSRRYYQSAVWTGTLMIVWGGHNDATPFNDTGGRYDPSTNSWTPTSAVGAPSPRYGHSAVWTGSLMVAWGGSHFNDLSTGGRYDPAADMWTPTSTTGSPAPRSVHTAVWTGNLMVIWGGYDRGEDFYHARDTGGRYDPVTDNWTPTSSTGAPSPRYGHSAVWTGSSMVVWGGRNDYQFEINTGGRYNPVNDSWMPTSMTGAPGPRERHAAVWTGNRMVVWGGNYLNTGGQYDPSTDLWTPTSTVGAPSGRSYFTAVWAGSRMVVWGGNGSGPELDTGGRYDPATDTWTPTSMTGVPLARELHTAVWTGSAMVVWGGHNHDLGLFLDTGGRYDPVTDSWTAMSTTDAPSGRWLHSAIWTGNLMVIWGAPPSAYTLNTGGRYDPATDAWTPTSTEGAPSGRLGHTAVWSGSAMLVWGGADNSTTLDTGGRYFLKPREVCNGTDDDCDGVIDNGGDEFCEDGNACTDDACQGDSGCTHNDNSSYCDDYNPCTSDTCDPQSGCIHTPEPEYAYCDDYDACTGTEYCDGYGTCVSVYPPQCDDLIVCTEDYCDPATGCAYRMYPAGTSCSDNNACNGAELCDGNGGCAPGTPLDCDDENPCTADWCDAQSGCRHGPEPLYTPCDDNNACTGVDYCDGFGTCVSPYPVQCPDNSACTEDFCDPAIGCVNRPYPSGTSCSDGNACNGVELCDGAGACAPGNPVVCSVLDHCHTVGVCDPASGACSNPNQPNGTVCNDGSLCTTGETCQSGTCTPSFSGLNEPNPRSNGYYMRLCLGPHSGDQLTDTDALCVGQISGTFAGITTVADLCAVLRPAHPNNDACGRTSADLMVLALNICRARVCTAQSIDSQCGNNDNVGQSLAESDAILLSPSRDDSTCAHAKCLDEEINTGRALELNTLGLRREGSGIRLDWRPPYLDDGTGHPSKYHVWRRVQGSLAPFSKIGTTTNPTYLDTLSGSGAFEYEVTAVMN